MKRLISLLLALLCIMSVTACNRTVKSVRTIEAFRTYSEMSDGSWKYDGHSYKHRLEISGRMPNAVKDSTFVYLSNIEEISFQRAMMASGVSSNAEDYFSLDEAVLVEMK